MGVERSGETVGRMPRPTGDVTSGDRGLAHSLEGHIKSQTLHACGGFLPAWGDDSALKPIQ